MKKIAAIRKNDDSPCPFGLPITFGCKYAGDNINNMASFDVMGDDATEEEKEMIGTANSKLLAWNLLRTSEKPKTCPYAAQIIENQEAVECNFEDSAPGESPINSLVASPFYSKLFNGIINGLYTYPFGHYSDYNVSRNLYYGTFSFANNIISIIKKIAGKE